MVKTREFCESERLVMYEKRISGHSYADIAREFGCSDNCVKKVVNKINNYGTANNLFRSGRNRCTSERTDSLIKQLVTKSRKTTVKEIKQDLALSNINISETTIRYRIREKGFFGGIARKRPAISPSNAAKRLAFAKKYIRMPAFFWKKILWSDESKFELINSKRRFRVWKKRGEGLNNENVSPTVKHSKSLMVWGCVSASGVGNLVEITSKMDAKTYVNILENNLIASAEKVKIQDNFIFQSDNDPKHTSKLAKKWLADNQINLLEWMAQSPDLNIIEHLWEHLDRSVPLSSRKSFATFKNALFKAWDEIGPEVIEKLVSSIPKRLQAVIDAKGYNTKY
jgi:transposase